jgi:hypothetical protein
MVCLYIATKSKHPIEARPVEALRQYLMSADCFAAITHQFTRYPD